MELEVRWENHLTGSLPVVVTVAPAYAVDGVPAQCLPGRSGGMPDTGPSRIAAAEHEVGDASCRNRQPVGDQPVGQGRKHGVLDRKSVV